MCWKENGNLKMKSALWQKNGGDEEDRTLDLTDANRTLSQLSYGPKQHIDYKPMLSKSQLLFFDFSEK